MPVTTAGAGPWATRVGDTLTQHRFCYPTVHEIRQPVAPVRAGGAARVSIVPEPAGRGGAA